MQLGSVTLHSHQADAVQRVTLSLEEFGGALLADEVGLGKTYVALAVARRVRRAIIVAPAALRSMWREAQAAAATDVSLISIERLSRCGTAVAGRDRYDLVVVDEAHHARNPRTRRYAALAKLAMGARVLLLTATPLHNRRRDVEALLALFLGERAAALDDADLSRCVVRRGRRAVADDRAQPPRVAPVVTLQLPPEDDLVDAIVSLPPPLPPVGAGDGGALVAQSLVRQWSSSRGALHAALRRRVVRAEAMLAALAQGSRPTVAELRRWIAGDDVVQLGLELFAPVVPADEALSAVLREHLDAVRALLRKAVQQGGDADRADVLRRIRRTHAGVPVVAFSHSAHTVRALWTLLAPDGGVCALAARGARVVGGRMSREEALDRFAPVARGRPPPPVAERITCLLTTDLLSEGVNLQDAGVVVHIDLPWTPARLEQRVGRVARAGSPHATVHVYSITPPASADAMLRVSTLLARKRALVAATIGGTAGDDSTSGGSASGGSTSGGSASGGSAYVGESAVAASEALRSVLARWLGSSCALPGPRVRPVVAATWVAERSPAALVLVRAGERDLVVSVNVARGTVSANPQSLLALAASVTGDDAPVDEAQLRRVKRIMQRWLSRRRAAESLGMAPPAATRVLRELLREVAALLVASPRHERVVAMADAERIRRAARGRVDAGAAAAIEALLGEQPHDRAWLTRTATLFAATAETAETARDIAAGSVDADSGLIALLLLQDHAARP